MVERGLHKATVAGPIPAVGTCGRSLAGSKHLPVTEGIGGSNPLARAPFFLANFLETWYIGCGFVHIALCVTLFEGGRA